MLTPANQRNATKHQPGLVRPVNQTHAVGLVRPVNQTHQLRRVNLTVSKANATRRFKKFLTYLESRLTEQGMSFVRAADRVVNLLFRQFHLRRNTRLNFDKFSQYFYGVRNQNRTLSPRHQRVLRKAQRSFAFFSRNGVLNRSQLRNWFFYSSLRHATAELKFVRAAVREFESNHGNVTRRVAGRRNATHARRNATNAGRNATTARRNATAARRNAPVPARNATVPARR